MFSSMPPKDPSSYAAALSALSVPIVAAAAEYKALLKVAAMVCNTAMAHVVLATESPLSCMDLAQPGDEAGILTICDTTLDRRFAGAPLVVGAPHLRFYAGVPIVLQDGARVGTLYVTDTSPRELNDTQRTILQSLAVSAAHLMQGKRAIRDQEILARELNQSKSLLDRTGALAGVGGWEIDLRDNAISWSDETCRIHGVEPGFVPSLEQALSYYPSPAREMVEAAVAQCIASGQGWDVEVPFIRRNGEQIWVRVLGDVELVGDRPVRVIGAVQNVSTRHRAELALALSESQFRGAFEAASHGIALVALDGQFLKVNHSLCTLLGYTEAELLTLTKQSITYPDDLLLDVDHAASLIAGRAQTYNIQKRYIHKNGRPVDVLSSVSLVRSQSGAPVHFVSQVQDITARMAGELALRESQVFQQSILDSINNQIAVLNHAGDIVATNQAWRQFGLDNSASPGRAAPNSDVGTNYLSICRSSGDGLDGAQFAQNGIEAVLAGRLPHFSCEYPCDSPDVKRWFSMTVTPINIGSRGAVVVHTDISVRKQAEELMRSFAYYDSLTLLANRRLLQEQLTVIMAQCRRNGLQGALMVLDLDNFKPLNDRSGHAVGDLLLQEVAKRLSGCVREIDTVARLGGDEFVVVLGELSSDYGMAQHQAMVVADKVLACLAEPYVLRVALAPADRTIEHHCSASIGVTLFNGHEDNQTAIFTRADAAMYRAKGNGRNQAACAPP